MTETSCAGTSGESSASPDGQLCPPITVAVSFEAAAAPELRELSAYYGVSSETLLRYGLGLLRTVMERSQATGEQCNLFIGIDYGDPAMTQMRMPQESVALGDI
jgi:hypothetical protein